MQDKILKLQKNEYQIVVRNALKRFGGNWKLPIDWCVRHEPRKHKFHECMEQLSKQPVRLFLARLDEPSRFTVLVALHKLIGNIFWDAIQVNIVPLNEHKQLFFI